MRAMTTLCGLMILVAAMPAASRNAPAPHCIDSRGIADAYQVDTRTLAIRGADGGRYAMTLEEACPSILAEPDTQVLAPDGWSCGLPGEVIRTASRSCAIAATRALDSRAYADLVRQAHEGVETLESVAVRGKRVNGFGGTTDYCVRSSGLRSWHEDGEGIVVEVSPRRYAGNRYYRVEMLGRCNERSDADTLELKSGLENGMICGRAGDWAVFEKLHEPTSLHPVESPMADHLQSGLAARSRCRITRVYPVER